MTYSRNLAAFAACVLVLLNGCTTPVKHAFPDPAQPAPVFPEQVQLSLRSGDTVTVRNARVVRDSIIGTRINAGQVGDSPFSVAVANVNGYSANKTNKGRTILAVALTVLAVVGLVSLASGGSSGSGSGY